MLPQSPFLLFHKIREIWAESVPGLMDFSLYFLFTLNKFSFCLISYSKQFIIIFTNQIQVNS
jgi:hypothetical protein